MKGSINVLKVSPPKLSSVVPRPRLFQRLTQNDDKQLIFILGQAAQGKSTLAASYLEELNLKPAWINLSAEESDPVNLFHALISALETAVNSVDFSAIKEYPAFSAGPRDENALYRDWLQSIFSLVSAPIHIVMDGLDRLHADAASHRFLQKLVEEKPSNVIVWILSRTVASFKLERLKMTQKMVLLDNQELSFTKDEIKTYCKKIKEMNLNTGQVNRIHQLSEGWVGGLILLSEKLDRLSEDSRQNYLLEDIPTFFKAEIFQYFAEEIFDAQPYTNQRLLMISSVFESIEPAFLNRLADINNAEQILMDLVKRNLFVQSVYEEEKGWLFRYHQLFKDFLRSKLDSSIALDEKNAVLNRAASLCARNGEWQNAANFYLEARNFHEAATVIESLGTDLLKSGRTADLSNLLAALTKDIVLDRPWLLLYSSVTRRFTGADENTVNLKNAFELFKLQKDERGQLLALAYLIEATMFRGRDVIPMAILLEEAEALLQTTSIEAYPWECATLWYQVGFGHTIRGADQRKGAQTCQNAYVLSKTIGNQPLQIYALSTAMLALSLMGDFSEVDGLAAEIKILLERTPFPEIRAYHLLNFSQCCTVQGDLETAQVSLSQAKDIIGNHGLLYLYPVLFFSELMLKPHLGAFKEAEETGSQLLQLTSTMQMNFINGISRMWLGLNQYLKEEYLTARQFFETSCRIVSSDESYSDTHIIWNKILMGLVLNHLKEYDRAEILLEDALNHFVDISSPLTIAMTHFALALIKQACSETKQAAIHLKEGFKIAADKKYSHFIFASRKDLVNLCIMAIEMDLLQTYDHVVQLLIPRADDSTIDELKRLSKHSDAKIKKNARHVLKSIQRTNLPILHVRSLNGFSVSRGEDIITEKEWGGSVPKQLLKIIISYGFEKIPKDLIMEDLWPNERKTASETNFKVNLHRLRRLLEPSMIKEFGSSYIHLKDNFISLEERLWQLDIAEFMDLKRKAEFAESKGDTNKAIAFLNDALKIYRNDFLANDLYIEGIQSKREVYRQEYLRILYMLAKIYEKRGTLKKAATFYKKIVAVDPISEIACQKLMINCFNRGKRNDAIRVYEEFKEIVRAEMDSEPDELTVSIYQKILHTNKSS
jgi:DNA-binding SARP family transcriptional activator